MHPRKDDDSCAIVWRDEGDDDDSDVNRITLKQLREQVMYALIYHIHTKMELKFLEFKHYNP